MAGPEGNRCVGRLSQRAGGSAGFCERCRSRTRSPERTDQINRRQANGSLGGRPPNFDADLSNERTTGERGFGRLRHWRGIATRYDKHALIYLTTIVLNHPIRI